MVMIERSELIIAVPAGPRVNGDLRHSEGSRLADPTHRLLQEGAGLRYDFIGRQLIGFIKGTNWRLVEFRGSDIPRAVADGDADVGYTTSDKALNLPDEEFDENGEFRRIKIMRELGYGGCEYRAGYTERLGVSEEATLEIAEGRVVGVGLEHLAKRIFRERRIKPADHVVRDGHVENTTIPPRGRAELILDIYEYGTTMRENHLIPAKEQLMLLQAIQIRRKGYLGRNVEEMIDRFDARIAIALEHPESWMKPQDRRLPQANPDFKIPQIPGIRQLTFPSALVVA